MDGGRVKGADKEMNSKQAADSSNPNVFRTSLRETRVNDQQPQRFGQHQHNIPLLPAPAGSIHIINGDYPPNHDQHNTALLPPSSDSADSDVPANDPETVQTSPNHTQGQVRLGPVLPHPLTAPEALPPPLPGSAAEPAAVTRQGNPDSDSDPALPIRELHEEGPGMPSKELDYDAIESRGDSGIHTRTQMSTIHPTPGPGPGPPTTSNDNDPATTSLPESNTSQLQPQPQPQDRLGDHSGEGVGALTGLGKVEHVIGTILGSDKLKAKGAMKMR
ncbi:hypothetical protein C8F01DRAFT_1112176 [Mycena amicta]|nr:hypothetical protein C8F01DRAFT_1112176 [Mycena amicta]